MQLEAREEARPEALAAAQEEVQMGKQLEAQAATRAQTRAEVQTATQAEVQMQAQMQAQAATATGGKQEAALSATLGKEFFARRGKIYPWLYAAGILLGELLVVKNARAGVLVHLLVLGGLLTQASLCSTRAAGRSGRTATPEADVAFEVAAGAGDARSDRSAADATGKTVASGDSGKGLKVLATIAEKTAEDVAGEFAAALNGSRFYLALTLAPLIRILSLSLPLAVFPLMYWYAVVSLPLLVGAAVVAVLNGYGRKDLGLTLGQGSNPRPIPVLSRGISPGPGHNQERSRDVSPGREQGLEPTREPGLDFNPDRVQNENISQGRMGRGVPVQLLIGLAGFPLGLLEFFILHPQPLVPAPDPAAIWLPALILLVCTGFTEEFIFRGIMQKAAVDFLGWRTAFILVSFIFAALHITHLSALDVFFVFGVAAFFATIVYRTGSLLGVTLAHSFTNITMYLFWPFVF